MADFHKIYLSAYAAFSEKMQQSVFQSPTKPKSIDESKAIPGNRMVYARMIEDYSRNLSNTINVFGYNIERLRAWHATCSTLNENDRDQVYFELVDNVFVVAMSTPYTMRDRFVFFGAQLCHQANRLRESNWLDDLPENHKIKFKHLEEKASKWSGGKPLVDAVSALNSDEYVERSKSFRNRFQHQLPSQDLIGAAIYFDRTKTTDGVWEYRLMQQEKVDLAHICTQLEDEFQKQLCAYVSFLSLLDEQTKNLSIECR